MNQKFFSSINQDNKDCDNEMNENYYSKSKCHNYDINYNSCCRYFYVVGPKLEEQLGLVIFQVCL